MNSKKNKKKLKITYIDSGTIDLEEAIMSIYAYIGQKALNDNNIKGYTIRRPPNAKF